jgi:hypothetical protein
MTTAAAIDRLVHHSIIIELNIPSYRLEQAKGKLQAAGEEATNLPRPPAPASGELPSGSGLRPPPPGSPPEARGDDAKKE